MYSTSRPLMLAGLTKYMYTLNGTTTLPSFSLRLRTLVWHVLVVTQRAVDPLAFDQRAGVVDDRGVDGLQALAGELQGRIQGMDRTVGLVALATRSTGSFKSSRCLGASSAVRTAAPSQHCDQPEATIHLTDHRFRCHESRLLEAGEDASRAVGGGLPAAVSFFPD